MRSRLAPVRVVLLDEGGVWLSGHLLRFDSRTGKRTSVVGIAHGRVSPAALSRGYVLFTAAGTVGAVDLTTERVAWRRRLGFRAGATLGGHGLVWVHSSAIHERGDRVTGMRLATGRLVTTAILPVFGSTGVAAGAGHVAIAMAGGHLVVLDPSAPDGAGGAALRRSARHCVPSTANGVDESPRPA